MTITEAVQPVPNCLGRMVTTDCMLGAAGLVSREWGDYGYVMGIHIPSGFGGAIFAVRHSDGSELFIHSDRYGDARQVIFTGKDWI